MEVLSKTARMEKDQVDNLNNSTPELTENLDSDTVWILPLIFSRLAGPKLTDGTLIKPWGKIALVRAFYCLPKKGKKVP